MNKLTLVVAGVMAAVVTCQAAITTVANHWGLDVDTPSELRVSGTWTIPGPVPPAFDTDTPPLVNWSVTLWGQSVSIGGGASLNILQVAGAWDAAIPGNASIGLLGDVLPLNNVAPPPGGAVASAPFVDDAGNAFLLSAYVGPAGTYNWKVEAVPEPGSYAMLAGLGLLGLAGYRRTRS